MTGLGTRCQRRDRQYPQLTAEDAPSLFSFDASLDASLTRRTRKPSVRPDAEAETRTFGGWTTSKLDLHRLYLRLYRQIAGGGTYVDGFAGTGRVRIEGESGDRPGSVETALESGGFRRLLVYEFDPRNYERLTRNLGLRFGHRLLNRVWTRLGDFNRLVLDDLAKNNIDRSRPCFAFLDPDSTQLDWSTIEALADYKGGDPPDDFRIELLILFNTDQAFVRLVPRMQGKEYPDSAMAQTLDRVMGGRANWDSLNTPEFSGTRLMHRYRDNLRALGYPFVSAIPIIDPASRRRQYYMVHASEHPKARELMVYSETRLHRDNGVEALLPARLFADGQPTIHDDP